MRYRCAYLQKVSNLVVSHCSMSQEKLVKIKSKSGTVIYTTFNKKKLGNKNFKLKLSKHDPNTGKHEDFVLAKK